MDKYILLRNNKTEIACKYAGSTKFRKTENAKLSQVKFYLDVKRARKARENSKDDLVFMKVKEIEKYE